MAQTHDEDGIPYEDLSGLFEPRSWTERAECEAGSLFDRTGLAYNRESYFR